MNAAQVARLKQIAEQMEVELITVDLLDHETLQALKAIVIPIAEALNIDAAPRDPGPMLTGTIFLDDFTGMWYGECAFCGSVTIKWEDRNIVVASLNAHMNRLHPTFDHELMEAR